MRIRVMDRLWTLKFRAYVGGQRGAHSRGDYGKCTDPEHPPREIVLREDLRGKQLLTIVLHEVLHAAGFHIDEAFVEKFGEDAAEVLTRPKIWGRIMEGM